VSGPTPNPIVPGTVPLVPLAPINPAVPGPTMFQIAALIAAVVVALGAFVVIILQPHRDPLVIFGFAGTIVTVLLAAAGLGSGIQTVHVAVNSRLDQLVRSTASDAFQRGQTAGPGAVPADPTVTPPTPPGG
jgi:hypothetical protein